MRLCLIAGCLLQLVWHAHSHPLETWYLRFATNTSNEFRDIVFGGNGFVAVGTVGSIQNSSTGFILTSSNGAVWSDIASPPLLSVAYGNAIYLAVGKTGLVMRSTNAINWTTENSGTTNRLNQIAFGNDTFVIVGGTNLILSSSNGIDWASQALPVTQLHNVTFGNGTFLAMASPSNNFISPNGLDWTPVPQSPNNSFFYTLEFVGGKFVVPCGNREMISSIDGVSWNSHGSNLTFRTIGLAFGHGFYVMASGSSFIEYSSTLKHWTGVVGAVSSGDKVAFGHGTFIVAGSGSVYQSDPIVNLRMLAPDKLFVETPVPTVLQIQSDSAFMASNNWQVITNLTITNSPFVWTNADPQPVNQNYFRAVTTQ